VLAHVSGFLRVLIISALTLCIFASEGFAQAAAPAAGEYRIAVADIQVLLADYNKRIRLYEELERDVNVRQQEIDQLSNRIEAAKQRFESQVQSMTETQRSTMRNEIESDYLTYTAELRKHQNYIDNREEAVLKEVLADIQAAIERVAIQDNYHLVLNAQRGPRGSVLYHSATIDITSKVLTVLNSTN